MPFYALAWYISVSTKEGKGSTDTKEQKGLVHTFVAINAYPNLGCNIYLRIESGPLWTEFPCLNKSGVFLSLKLTALQCK